MRLVKLFKLAKNTDKMLKVLKRFISIGVGLDRILIIVLVFIILTHLVACTWIFIPSMFGPPPEEDSNYASWIHGYSAEAEEPWNIYLVSVYWTVTTISTVGYGDISG